MGTLYLSVALTIHPDAALPGMTLSVSQEGRPAAFSAGLTLGGLGLDGIL